MALVSGHLVSSFGELSPMPVASAELSPDAEDSDDDYAYVSSLAEQIAHALMLDDDEEPPAVIQPSPSFHPGMRHHNCQDCAWPCTSLHPDQEFESTGAEVIHPVSNLAVACQDNAPSEWDCLYNPSLQQTSKQLFTLYTRQLDLKCNHQFQEWNATHLDHNELAAAYASKIWDLNPQESCPTSYHPASSVRKESIGTGVFLPKIVYTGPHYRKKAGFTPSRSAFAPRHKC